MSLKRWAAKRDQNEGEIVAALRQVGAQVEILSGKGVCDLLVLHRGRLFLLEIKTSSGRTTAAQQHRSRLGWPVIEARTVIEALHAIGVQI